MSAQIAHTTDALPHDTGLLIRADDAWKRLRPLEVRALKHLVGSGILRSAMDNAEGDGLYRMWRMGLTRFVNVGGELHYAPCDLSRYIVLLATTETDEGKTPLLTVVARWDREDGITK